jgi:hypothetical protein
MLVVVMVEATVTVIATVTVMATDKVVLLLPQPFFFFVSAQK